MASISVPAGDVRAGVRGSVAAPEVEAEFGPGLVEVAVDPALRGIDVDPAMVQG